MDMELNVDMVNEGIACLPRDNKKYAGSVTRVNKDGGNVAWLLKVKQSFVNYQKEFATEVEAYAKMRDINLRACLEIKNCFTVFEDHVVVQLSEGEEFICGPDDLHIVEDHIWCLNSNEEIITKIDGRVILLGNMVINHLPNKQNTIYHIKRDCYDCHKSNLGIADKRRQNIDHPIQKNNRSGIIGVYCSRQKNTWYAKWADEDGNSHKKSYSSYKHGFVVAKQG